MFSIKILFCHYSKPKGVVRSKTTTAVLLAITEIP